MNNSKYKERAVYLDNAATTRMSDEVKAAMEPYLKENFGNASTIYGYGENAKEALRNARETIAETLEAKPSEIFFTSGGSESDNWAVKCIAGEYKHKGTHIITSKIEHHAILNSCAYLEQLGYEVTYLPVDGDGLVDPANLEAAIRPDTILISVMAANNEIGTIQPIAEIGAIAKAHKVLFHTDAVQAVGHIPVDVEEWNVDLLSLSGHKFGGPKGIGALYMKKPLRLPALIQGGGQEKGRRSGTENVPGAVGMAAALKEATDHLPEESARLAALRDKLIAGLSGLPYASLTGHPVKRLPGTASFVFEGVEGVVKARGRRAMSGS